ncbi:MAG: T9SS type A sorting domain-containing protein [Taibaiella sp.]|nr:T9SS type A sorting domain-containing protein [Taibaiella sp.]
MKNFTLILVVFILTGNPIFAQNIHYYYDNHGRLTNVQYPDSSEIAYTYDNGGNRVGMVIKDPCRTKPKPIVTSLSGSFAICPGDSVFLTSSPGISYLWSTGDTTQTIKVLAAGNYAVIRYDTFQCYITSDSVAVTFKPVPTLSSTLTPPPICNNAIFAYTPTSATAGTIFSWSRAAVPGISTPASGGTGSVNESLSNTTALPVAVAYRYTLDAGGCVTTVNVIVSVNPSPSSTSITGPLLYCSGVSDTLHYILVGGTWSSGNPSVATIGSSSGIITAVSGGTATVTYNTSCSTSPAMAVITVNQTPAVTPVADQIRCNGIVTTPVVFTGMVSGTVYNWTNSLPSIGLAASGTGNIPAFTAINTGGIPINASVIVTPSTSTCIGIPDTFSFIVNPVPDIIPQSDQTVCKGSLTTAISFISSVPAATFNWSNSNTTIGLSGSGSGNIPAFTAMNPYVLPVVATIIVTPSAYSCAGLSDTFTITVNPVPNMATPANQQLCNGMLTAPVIFSSSLTGTSFNWTNDNMAIGLTGSGSGNIASFMATNATGLTIIGTIIVTPTAYSCPGTSRTFTISVKPTPTLSSPISLTACTGKLFKYKPTSVTPGITYSWRRDMTTGISNSGYYGVDSISETLINYTPDPVPVTYVYTLTGAGCVSTQNVIVVVNPLPIRPSITTKPASILCANTEFINLGTHVHPVEGTTYEWTTSNATLMAVGVSGQYCLVTFDTVADAVVALIATQIGTGCSNRDTFRANIQHQASHHVEVLYYGNELVCESNIMVDYQWGYDDSYSLDSTLLPQGREQSYYLPIPDFVHKYYWVITTKDGCIQKTYYNTPALDVVTANNPNDADIKIYPNPTEGLLNIEIITTIPGHFDVEIQNILGQKIARKQLFNRHASVDLNNAAPGCYVVVCYLNGIKIGYRRFVKD